MIRLINYLCLFIKKISNSSKISPNKGSTPEAIYCNSRYSSKLYDIHSKKKNNNMTNYIQYLESRIFNLEGLKILENNYFSKENKDDLILKSYLGCDIFLSYKQNDGSDAIAINMYYSLKEKNINVWLDKMRDDERSESGMVAGVKSSKLFCAIISPNYFNSYFCLLELKTAILNSKKIVLCFNGSKFKIQESLNWIINEYNYLKNDELIKLDEDNEYMKIGLEKVCKRFYN